MEDPRKIEIGVLYRYDWAVHLTSMTFFNSDTSNVLSHVTNNKEGERTMEAFPGLILHVAHLTSLVFGMLLKQFRNFTHFTYAT
jgi:hypothetical protein